MWSTMATVSKLLLNSLSNFQVLCLSSVLAALTMLAINAGSGKLALLKIYPLCLPDLDGADFERRDQPLVGGRPVRHRAGHPHSAEGQEKGSVKFYIAVATAAAICYNEKKRKEGKRYGTEIRLYCSV